MRYFAVAYLGWGYHGSQRQPGLRTVEGEIEDALARMGISCRARLRSRTDAGVSARMNVLELSVDVPEGAVVGLNRRLDDIRLWGYFESKPKIFWREYWYLVSDLDLEGLRMGLEFLSSLDDLSPFVKGHGSPGRVEMGLRPGRPTILWFRSRYFRWQMVRRMVSFVISVACGADPQQELRKAKESGGYRPADPRFLVLWETRTDQAPRPLDTGSWSEELFLRSRILYIISEGLRHGAEGLQDSNGS